jgi:hypothetical protein
MPGEEVDVWQAVVDYLEPSIFGGVGSFVICTVFILGLCAYGLIKSRKIYTEV